MTIDELIIKLQELREQSKLGGNTVVYLCRQDLDDMPLVSAYVENDADGAVCLLLPKYQD